MFFALMPMTVAFPLEVEVLMKEKSNGWYDTGVYYIGKMIADLPFQFLMPIMYSAISYTLGMNPPELWRWLNFAGIMILNALCGQTIGLYLGAAFHDNIPAAVFLGPMSCIPFILFSGIFIRVSSMPSHLSWLSYLDYMRFSFEGNIVSLYGFGRCGANATSGLLAAKKSLFVWMSEMLGADPGSSGPQVNYTLSGVTTEFVDEIVDSMAGPFISDDDVVQSASMNEFDLYDYHLYRAWGMLALLLLIKRVAVYFVIVKKVNSVH